MLKFFIHTNFNAIANKPVQVYEILQKIVLEVDEDGGENDTSREFFFKNNKTFIFLSKNKTM